MAKIVFLGAGSVEFTQKLLVDILSFPELRNVTIALHDINPRRLEMAAAIARRTCQALRPAPEIQTSGDRRAALAGANYVINTIQVGGHEATVRDFEIPNRYGLKQTIGDTIGVGGIFRGLRTMPVVLAIANEIAELCPQAWLLNYTNPMAMLCSAVYLGTPVRQVLGLCHSVEYTMRQLAGLIAVPLDAITFLSAGVNHQAFMLRFERNGTNLYPALDEVIARQPELSRRVRVEIYRRLGYFPTESSEHAAEYVPWFLPHPAEIERFRIPVGEYVRRSAANLRRAEEAGKDIDPAGETERSVEYAPLVIHSLETGSPRDIYANVRNDGLIDNLPAEACVEVPCRLDRQGVHPRSVGSLPVQLAALNRTYLNVVELTVRAALDRDGRHVRHAATLDPNTSATLTLDQIWSLCDELTEAHRELLPGYLTQRQRATTPP